MAGCGGGQEPSPEPALATLSRPVVYMGHDYLFVRSPRSWDQAGALCDSLGYGLVTINDDAEEKFLQSFEGTSAWWIGYNDIQTEGTFLWRNGTSSYTRWGSGEPDNYLNEDCVEENYSNTHLWNDAPCSTPFYFICESLD